MLVLVSKYPNWYGDNHFSQCNRSKDLSSYLQQILELQRYLRAHEFSTVVRSDLYKALQEVNNFKLPRKFPYVFIIQTI